MHENPIQSLEFFGGPMDGHVETFVGPLRPFAVIKTLAMDRNVNYLTMFLHVLFFYDKLQPRVLAIYELYSDERSYSYRYVVSISEKQAEFNPKIVDTTVHNPYSAATLFAEPS